MSDIKHISIYLAIPVNKTALIVLLKIHKNFINNLTQPQVAAETEVRAYVDETVSLGCKVDVKQCGTLHSVKWYKDTSRIYVYSQAGSITRAEGDAEDRLIDNKLCWQAIVKESTLQRRIPKGEDVVSDGDGGGGPFATVPLLHLGLW
ncbi:unnamed protein product [Brassicogethes aeneus]|uniref:Ig-like domain-containing protein n=1 Tax=Brassicogethes aeneus TaxID=1431903 RepID=A0A9P0FAI4_BRAAE|nr:unnamed protein product [Brassicogethes aeneus]